VAEQRQQICASHFSHPGVKAIRPFPSSHLKKRPNKLDRLSLESLYGLLFHDVIDVVK
jgi:hypothetical protein